MNEIKLKLSPPWVTYVNKLIAMFDGDPEIAVNFDARKPAVVLATNNGDKNAALHKLLPEKVKFGNVTLTISTDGPMSNLAFETNEDLFKTAFSRNPVLAYVQPVECLVGAFTYVVFKNTVVQFFNDNINDIHGVVSTLYQDIAAELFEDANLHGVAYCTDVERSLGKPLGEWP